MPQINKNNDLLADWADALASMGQAIIVFDEHQNMAMATPQARNLLSGFWSIDEWSKLHLPDITTLCYENSAEDAGPSGLMENILNAFGDTKNGFSEVITSPNGQYLLIQIVGFQQTGTIVLIKDISTYTHWYKITKTSDEEREMLLLAIELAIRGLALFDPSAANAPLLFVNQAFCKIFHTTRADILGQPVQKYVTINKNSESDYIFQRQEDNKIVNYQAQISIAENLGIIFISDVTDAKQKEDQIRHMQRLDSIGQLAGGVAHDFNNILGIIKGYSHLLLPQFKGNTEATDALSRMLHACDRGSALSEQLLTISRKKQPTLNASCSVSETLTTIQKLLKPLIPHEVILEIPPISRLLHADLPEDQMNQIFMNLILNGRDAMPNGGRIRIMVTEPAPETPTQIIFKVSDTGTGIPPDVMARIFEPFFTTKELGKGTGLGLAVIYGIIQQYAGAISVDSIIGYGTTFTLSLPGRLMGSETDSSLPQSDVPTEINLKGITIMVVEDEPDLRQPLVTFLTQQNATVLQAEDGNQALAIQDDHAEKPIDILISDIRMPGGLYGDDLARLWRAIRPDSKIILMSGYAEGRDINDGCTDLFLKKPTDFQTIYSSIATLIHKKNGTS